MTFNTFFKVGALAGAALLVLNQPVFAAFDITAEEANAGYGSLISLGSAIVDLTYSE